MKKKCSVYPGKFPVSVFSFTPCFNAYCSCYVHLPPHARSFRNTRNSQATISLIYFQRLWSCLQIFMYVTYWASAVKFFFFRQVSASLRLWNVISPNPQDTGVTAFQRNRSQWIGKSSDIYIYICINVLLLYPTFILNWWKWGDSVADTETCYGLDNWRLDPQWGMNFSLRQKPPSTALEPSQTRPLGMAGRAVDIRPPASTGFRTEYRYISTSPLRLHGTL
jgi:hypothetical protein